MTRSAPKFQVGQTVIATVQERLSRITWACAVEPNTEDTNFRFISRTRSNWALDDVVELVVWSVESEQRVVLLTDEYWPSLPVSALKAELYRNAITQVLVYLDSGVASAERLPEAFSTVKGLAGVCINRERDWLEIHRVFGEPSRDQMRELSGIMTRARKAFEVRDAKDCLNVLGDLQENGFRAMLEDLGSHLSSR